MSTKTKLTITMIVFFMIIAYPGIRSIHAAMTFERTDMPPHEETFDMSATSAGAVVMPPNKTRASGQTGRVTATVDLLAGNAVETERPGPRYILSEEEKHMLCFVADREDHTSVESRLAVMQVVMNRTYHSDKFPESVYDVLYQQKQFGVMKRYTAECTPSADAAEALARLLCGDDIFAGECALFFAANHVNPSRIARGLYLVAEVGKSKFWGQE